MNMSKQEETSVRYIINVIPLQCPCGVYSNHFMCLHCLCLCICLKMYFVINTFENNVIVTLLAVSITTFRKHFQPETLNYLCPHISSLIHVYIQQAMSVQVWLTGNAGQLFIEITFLIYCSIVNYMRTQNIYLDNFIIHNITCCSFRF